VILGSRGSKLALWQSNWVSDRLREAHPGLEVEIRIIKTTGDRFQQPSIPELGGKGAFTKEIQDALLASDIDLAVHSLKDLPTWPVPGLRVLAYPERVDPRDAWVSRDGTPFAKLAEGDRVATGSLRRQAQLRNRFGGVRVESIRGNVDTRLRKLRESDMTGMVLAMAGLTRLGLLEHVTEPVDPKWMLPSPGQGALAVEGRDEAAYAKLLEPLEHAPTRRAVEAERALLAGLEGSCQVPIGGLAREEGETLILDGLLASPDGSKLVRKTERGPLDQTAAIGTRLAARIRGDGGGEILRILQDPGEAR